MQIKNRLFLLGAVGVVLGSFAQACATEAGTDDDVVEDAGVDTGTKDSGSDTGAKDTGADVTVPDAGRDTGTDTGTPIVDAGRDTGPDAGPNLPGETVDPTAPKEGDACPAGVVENGVMDRRCGYCGNQKSFCTNGKVGAYGPCTDEKNPANRCLPNASRGITCGVCGTQVDTCDPDACTWSAGSCENELASGCVAGEVTYITGACANPDEVRKQTCSATCSLGAPEPCAVRPIDTLELPTNGTTASAIYKLSVAGELTKRPSTGSCPATTFSTSSYIYHFALLKNSTSAPIVVETWPSQAPNGSTIDTVTVAYAAATRPKTDADLKTCTGTVNDTCSAAPCVGTTTSWSGLAGTNAITIPANSTMGILTTVYANGNTFADKAFQFNARVKP